MAESCISFLVYKTGSYLSESSAEGQLGHFNPQHKLFILKSTNTERLLTVCVFFTEEEEAETADYRDENKLSGGEEPEWETDERSCKAANLISIEGSIQNMSGDKEDQMENESVSVAPNQGGAPHRKSLSTRRNLCYSRICTERLTRCISELKAKPARTHGGRKVRVVLKRLSEASICSPNGGLSYFFIIVRTKLVM